MPVGTASRVGPYQVLAIGAANMDIAASTRLPLLPGDSTPGQVRCAPGGVARNVAENLARLGVPVGLLSVVGDDLNGHSLLASTGSAGVDTSGCWVLPGQATSTYVSLHGPDGEMAAAVNDMGILDGVTPELLSGRADRIRHATALLLDCNLPEPALDWLFTQARDAPVFVDAVSATKCLRIQPWLKAVHTLKANRLEAEALCGRPLGSDAAISSAAAWLHAQGVQQVVLSLGERGVYWSAHPGVDGAHTVCGWQSAVPVTVVNATGAGDALMAGLLHHFLQQVPLQQAVRFAAGCASLALTAPQANHAGLSVAAVRQLLATTSSA